MPRLLTMLGDNMPKSVFMATFALLAARAAFAQGPCACDCDLDGNGSCALPDVFLLQTCVLGGNCDQCADSCDFNCDGSTDQLDLCSFHYSEGEPGCAPINVGACIGLGSCALSCPEVCQEISGVFLGVGSDCDAVAGIPASSDWGE